MKFQILCTFKITKVIDSGSFSALNASQNEQAHNYTHKLNELTLTKNLLQFTSLTNYIA